MFTIDRVILREVRLRLKEPFRISSGEVHDRRILLCELEGSGATRTVRAWGECVAGERPNYSYETIDTAWPMLAELFVPRVLGKAFVHPREIAPLLEGDLKGHRMAKASLEMAGWELFAQLEGVPLAQVLGGERREVEAGISLGLQATPAELLVKAQAAVDRGYRKIKIKIRPGADLEYLTALRRGLPPGTPLAVDANAAYTPADSEHLKRFDPIGMLMMEQPLEGEDLLRHARLQKELVTPLCLDESITSLNRAADMIELGAGKIINIKPGRVGGFAASIAIHDLCREHGIPVWCGGMLESGIGRAHNVALASLPNFCLPGDLSPSERYWQQDVVTPEWTMDDHGRVRVPWDRPGMGVEVDREHLDRITVRSQELRPS
ncbi:MAG: o-succinylbenzoate synthase [Thermoanaerobaculia bacterium]|nr:o-succinylbenzoate synthase [Thermoanaerobaculia bacterium]